MINIEELIKAYEIDAKAPEGLGRFEVLNMLNNRDILEEHRNRLTTVQATRLLVADERLMSNSDLVVAECGGETEYTNIRQHNPAPSAWWWFLEQVSAAEMVGKDQKTLP